MKIITTVEILPAPDIILTYEEAVKICHEHGIGRHVHETG